MSHHIEMTPEAESDLRRIYRHIAEEKGDPVAAFKLVDSIYAEIATLDEMPCRYPIWRNELWKSRSVRSLDVGNYHVFYLVEEVPPTVFALRVFYQGQDV